MNTTVPKPKLHAGYMELAVARLLNPRVDVIVPNISWGLGLDHECDLLVLDGKNRFTEIEIKISLSDLKADFKKEHNHHSVYISRLIYAVPDFLVDAAKELVPSKCGIIEVKWNEWNGRYYARWIRQCRHDKSKLVVDQGRIEKFMQLGCMRIWSLKEQLYKLKEKPTERQYGT